MESLACVFAIILNFTVVLLYSFYAEIVVIRTEKRRKNCRENFDRRRREKKEKGGRGEG